MSSSKDVPKPQPYGQSPVDLAKVSKKLQVLKASQDSEEAGEGRRYEVDFDSNKVIGYEVDYASDSEDEDAHMAWAMGYEESEDSDSIEGKGEAGVTKYNDVKDYNAAEGKSTAHLTKVEEVDETSEDSGKIQEKGKSNVTKVKAAKFQYAKDSDKANTNANANAKAPHTKGKVKAINPNPCTPPAQTGPKEYTGHWDSPDSQVIESGDCTPSQEGVWRKDRTSHAPPGGKKLPPGGKFPVIGKQIPGGKQTQVGKQVQVGKQAQGRKLTSGGKLSTGGKLDHLHPSGPPGSKPAPS